MIHPFSGSSGPDTAISTLNEWPWSLAQLWLGGRFGSRWAASIVNDLRISIIECPTACASASSSATSDSPGNSAPRGRCSARRRARPSAAQRSGQSRAAQTMLGRVGAQHAAPLPLYPSSFERSEEHTSELQSRGHLVCRLLLEKKKKERQNKAGIRYMGGRETRAEGRGVE